MRRQMTTQNVQSQRLMSGLLAGESSNKRLDAINEPEDRDMRVEDSISDLLQGEMTGNRSVHSTNVMGLNRGVKDGQPANHNTNVRQNYGKVIDLSNDFGNDLESK